jgi:hypothetical protein
MSRADQIVERGADRLRLLSDRMAARGDTLGEKLAQELAEDAAFLRKLKPSLMVARARGEAPTTQKPDADVVGPTGPQIPKRPKPPGAGPSPWLVVGAALAVGIAVAKLIDWRSHAHPRD